MNERLLVVEDEPSMLKGLMDVLAVKGYQADTAIRGDEGLDKALRGNYDLVLLDVMLPELSGFDVLRAIRKAGCRSRVILLTARNTEIDKVLGFELGVDDYVTKPFSLLELLGRIGAVLRRNETAVPPDPDCLSLGEVVVDLKRYKARLGDESIELPARAFDLLSVLARHRGEAVSRDALIDEVWGKDEFINQRSVNNLVYKIRQAVEADVERPRYLKTVHGLGYRLDL